MVVDSRTNGAGKIILDKTCTNRKNTLQLGTYTPGYKKLFSSSNFFKKTNLYSLAGSVEHNRC
jgi:hypothetical protein